MQTSAICRAVERAILTAPSDFSSIVMSLFSPRPRPPLVS